LTKEIGKILNFCFLQISANLLCHKIEIKIKIHGSPTAKN
jgi:hypothetical protein